MLQVVRQVLDQLGRLFLPALDFDDFRDSIRRSKSSASSGERSENHMTRVAAEVVDAP